MTDKLMGDYTLREARDICGTFYVACGEYGCPLWDWCSSYITDGVPADWEFLDDEEDEDEEDDEMVKPNGNLRLEWLRNYCQHHHDCNSCMFDSICCAMPSEWELSEDDFEPRKPLKDWTLGEVERHCHEHNDCNKCELSNWCEKVCKSYPWSWEMEEYDR